MNRITLLALGFLSFGIFTSASAQTKVTQLIVQNTTGTTKLTQTGTGLTVDNTLILQRPGATSSQVTLTVPNTGSNLNFSFPTAGGTLLTTDASAIINAINSSNMQINASNLDLTGVGTVTSLAAGSNALTVVPNVGDVTVDLNLANANNWTGVQYLPANLAQGNNLIDAINMGTTPLAGYVTNTYLTNNYTTTTNMNAAIAAAVSAGGSSVIAGNYTDTTYAYNADVTLSTSDLSKYTAWMLTPNGQRTLSLGNGSNVGQLLTFVNTVTTGLGNRITISDATNVNVPGSSHTLYPGATISFIWSGSVWYCTSVTANN